MTRYPSRRDALFTTIAAPLLRFSKIPGIELMQEATLLSQESAQGFCMLTGGTPSAANRARLLILPGACNLNEARLAYLRRQASLGSWIVIESGLCFSSPQHIAHQASLLAAYIGIEVNVAPPRPGPQYVAYQWPQRHVIRSFGTATQVRCLTQNVVATSAGAPICSMHWIGLGGIVFLGSMLGPSLFGEDAEAHQLCRAIFHQLSLRCAGRLSGDKATTA